MFNFPKIERDKSFKYKKNLLKSVIFQLQFPKSDEILIGSKEIRDKLKNSHPIFNPIYQNQAQIKFGKDKTPILQSARSSTGGYEFKTEDNSKTLSITEDTLSYIISGPVYQNFYEAIAEIKVGFFPILEEFGISNFNRIAIRKINLIEPVEPDEYTNETALLSVFNENLINNIKFLPDKDSVVSAVTSVKMEDEDKRLNVSYGLISLQKKQILLDLDLFFINQDVRIEVVESKWEEINNELFNIFNWAISDEMKSDLTQ